MDKGTVRVLASACTINRALDTPSAVAGALTSITPEESPLVCVALHCCARLASVGLTCSIWVAMVAIILVILSENGKCLSSRNTGVVAALSGLDGLGDFRDCTIVSQTNRTL